MKYFQILITATLFFICLSCTETSPSSSNDAQKKDATMLTQAIDDTLIVIDSIAGFLNNDDLMDYILVCKSKNESETEYDEYQRKTYLYIGQSNGSYLQHSSNIGAVLCKNCGGIFGDPYSGISIEPKNGFTINHYGGSNFRWELSSQFNYDQITDNWILVRQENISYSVFEPENIETEIFTSDHFGTVTFQEFDINNYQ